MDWQAVKRHNAKASARKAKRERHAVERKAAIERMGGPITLAEIRSAARRTAPPEINRIRPMEVWAIRDRDWVIGFENSCAYPFVSWRMDGRDLRATPCPVTYAAEKWLKSLED